MVSGWAMNVAFAVTESLTVSFSRVLSQILLFSGRNPIFRRHVQPPLAHHPPISSAPVELKLPVPGYMALSSCALECGDFFFL
jgi:hypothetical protein